MKKLFSDDVSAFFRSPVRDIFKKVDLNAIYSFAGGYPSAETFPIDRIQALMDTVIKKYGARAFQYGATQGVTELRSAIAKRYDVDIDHVQITTSSQQGIDVLTRVLINPHDVIITSAPTYLGALQSFASYRAEVIGIPHCNDIVKYKASFCQAIDDCLSQGKQVKMMYIIPDFQNPSGETLTLEERKALTEIAAKYDLIIIEDSPYRELRYEGLSLPTLYSLCPERVMHLGSFSKIFAPGFRLGWMIGNDAILDKVYVCKQSLDLCPPIMDQYIAAEFITSGALDENLQETINLYRHKRDIFDNLLRQHMPAYVKWTRPEGGLFLFLTLPEGVDTVAMYDLALSHEVAYVAGSFFYPGGKEGKNTIRLNFSFIDTARMETGIKILADVIKKTAEK